MPSPAGRGLIAPKRGDAMIDMGQLPDGRRVQAVDLQAGRLRARVLTFGGIVQDLRLDGIDHPLVL